MKKCSKLPFRLCLMIIVVFLYAPVFYLVVASSISDSRLSVGIPSLSYGFEYHIGATEFLKRVNYIFSDKEIYKSLTQSIVTSISCGITVALISWVAGYVYTRSSSLWIKSSLYVSLLTYLFPPAALAIGISDIGNIGEWFSVKLQIFLGHCLYLFPLAYVMSIGFWLQKPHYLDRMAASDGLAFFERIFAHMGGREMSRFFVIALLVFMVSWGDIVFSRVLGSADNSNRLLPDLVFQRLYADQLSEPYGSLAVFALFVVLIAAFFSAGLGFIMERENEKG